MRSQAKRGLKNRGSRLLPLGLLTMNDAATRHYVSIDGFRLRQPVLARCTNDRAIFSRETQPQPAQQRISRQSCLVEIRVYTRMQTFDASDGCALSATADSATLCTSWTFYNWTSPGDHKRGPHLEKPLFFMPAMLSRGHSARHSRSCEGASSARAACSRASPCTRSLPFVDRFRRGLGGTPLPCPIPSCFRGIAIFAPIAAGDSILRS